MISRPDPRAELKAFMAMALDLARVDPERRPGIAVQRWHRELASLFGVSPRPVHTNRELLAGAVSLHRAQQDRAAPVAPA